MITAQLEPATLACNNTTNATTASGRAFHTQVCWAGQLGLCTPAPNGAKLTSTSSRLFASC
jgi:hypothetical protein